MSVLVSDSNLAFPNNLSPKLQRALVDRMYAKSFPAFFQLGYTILHPGKPLPEAKYVYAMLHKLEQLVTGDLRRLVSNVPPRHGKSEFGTCMLAAWILGRDPAAKVFVVSYGLSLSTDLTSKIRRIVTHPAYQRVFPSTRIKLGHNRADHFVTTAGGECMAASQDSGITGFGTHYMLVDDFQKADEALSPIERENAIITFKNTLLSRFDNLADGRILINQQRLHEDDISGWALSLGWPHLRLAAIAEEDEVHALPRGKVWHRKKGELLDPVRCPMSYLEEQRLAQGPRFFAAQFQQNPGVAEGGLIQWPWFGQYDEAPPRRALLRVVQSWDPAITERIHSDYSVGMTWGYDGRYWYLLDLIRAKLEFGALLDRVMAWHARWRADALIIEGASIGHSLWQIVRRKLPGLVLNPTPTVNKIDRLAARTAQLQTGNYLLPASAPWLADLRTELLGFPDWRHDDQVDALTQFLQFEFEWPKWMERRFDEHGRRLRSPRPVRRPRCYEDDDR